jgi:hypothetical protein
VDRAVCGSVIVTVMTDHDHEADIQVAGGARPKRELEPGKSNAPESKSEIVLNWAGFFVGLLIMTGDYVVAGRSMSPQNWEFLRSPKAMVWIFFVAGQFAFWAIAIEPLWRGLARLRTSYGLRHNLAIRSKLAAAVVFFALPGFFLVYIVPDSNLAHHDAKMGLVNLVAMIVALVAVAGIWDVRAALESVFGEQHRVRRPPDSVQQTIEILVDLRDHLQRFITLLGAMVALATLAKGALRQAILATDGMAAQFPPEYVLLQGAYFTALLALVYIPTYSILADVGAGLVDSVYPVKAPDLDWEHFSEWQDNRKSLEDFLELKSGAVHNFRASVAILAPVATSVVAVLLGTK